MLNNDYTLYVLYYRLDRHQMKANVHSSSCKSSENKVLKWWEGISLVIYVIDI